MQKSLLCTCSMMLLLTCSGCSGDVLNKILNPAAYLNHALWGDPLPGSSNYRAGYYHSLRTDDYYYDDNYGDYGSSNYYDYSTYESTQVNSYYNTEIQNNTINVSNRPSQPNKPPQVGNRPSQPNNSSQTGRSGGQPRPGQRH